MIINNPTTIRDDWATAPQGFVYLDDGARVIVTITAKSATQAVPELPPNPTSVPPFAGRPGAAAAPKTLPLQFILWGPNTPTTYTQANAMNGGITFSTADLIAAITAYLATRT
jgi:hypothetical protein